MSRLESKRILVTSATTYMGPPIVELFGAEGADVIADEGDLIDPSAPTSATNSAGAVDAIIANLDLPAYLARATEIEDETWLAGFDAMVHPLMRLVRAAT